jgi:multidrug efflux pump subunit AcrB
MKALIAGATRHPVFANLLMAVVLIGGIAGFLMLRRELTPQFSANRVQVFVAYPGASAEEIEDGITLKIERAIQGIPGIKDVESVSREGSSLVVCELEERGADPQRVLQDVRNRVDTIRTFPEESERPEIAEILLQNPAVLLVLHGPADEDVLREMAMEIRDELLAQPDISLVEIDGIRNYEIAIEVSEAALREYGLTLDLVADAVRRASLNLPGGSLRTSREQFKIEIRGRKYRAINYRDVVVVARENGTTVRLDQVARVRDTFNEDEAIGRYDGRPAVLIRIMRTSDQDILRMAANVRKYLEEKQRVMPSTMKLTVFTDFSKLMTDRLDLLVSNAKSGLILVFLCLWAFLSLRVSFWVALGIPTSFAFCGAVLYFTGQTLNMINLFGLIMVLGLVVDDAIVIGENITSMRERGVPLLRAAIIGTQQMAWPVLATVTTTMVAFMPMFFMTGMFGKFIAQIPIVVVATLAGSLVESLLILPNHLAHEGGLKRWAFSISPGLTQATATVGQGLRGGMEKAIRWVFHLPYQALFRYAMRFRYVPIAFGFTCLLLTVGCYLGGFISYEIFGAADAESVLVEVTFPEGTPIDKTRAALIRIEDAARTMNEERSGSAMANGGELVEGLYSYGGGEGRTHFGGVWILFCGPEKRTVHSEKLTEELRQRVGLIPDAISVMFGSRGGPRPPANDIELYVFGEDLSQLRQASEELAESIRSYDGTSDVRTDFQPGKRELRIELLPQGRVLGITLQDLALQLRHGFYGAEAIRLQRGRDEVKVQVRYPPEERASFSDLFAMRIRTPRGEEVPFDQVARFRMVPGIAEIRRRNGERRVAVLAGVDKTRGRGPDAPNADRILAEVEETYVPPLLEKYPRLRITTEGASKETRESFQSLGRGFIFALFGIFAILALIFRSYVQPVLIMFTIPLGIVGAVMGHMVYGINLTMLSLFGIVALAGIVVNDAIVLIEYINERLRGGATVLEAVGAAGPARLRAVLLTSLTTVAGLLPLLYQRSFQAQFLIPMALSLASGLIFATFLTLFFVPCAFLALNDARCFQRWLYSGLWPSREEVEPAWRHKQWLAEEDAQAAQSPAAEDTPDAADGE